MKRLSFIFIILTFWVSHALGQEYTFGYSSDRITGLGVKTGDIWMASAIKIPYDRLVQLGATTIKSIHCGIGDCGIKEGFAFLTYDLKQGPEELTRFEIGDTPGWQDAIFATPVTLKPRTDVYVGYYLKTTSSTDWPIGTDQGTYEGKNADLVSYSHDFDKLWTGFTSQNGNYGNVCIRVTVEGESLPTDRAKIQGVEFPIIMRPAKEFDADVTVSNEASNPIDSLTFDLDIAYETAYRSTVKLNQPLPPAQTTVLKVPLVCDSDSWNLPIRLSISQVNGSTINPVTYYKAEIVCSKTSFERNVVVEEATSLQGGECPIGYAGIKAMKEKYDDGTFIPISIHNNRQGYDQLCCGSYEGWLAKWGNGANPVATVNRSPLATAIVPNFANLEKAYKSLHGATLARITTTAEQSSRGYVLAKSEVEFAVDINDANYGVVFVLTEDSIGPLSQKNNFSGKKSGGMAPEFERKGNPTLLIFNDVARKTTQWTGIKSSIPSRVLAGEKYNEEIEVRPEIWNPYHTNVTGLLIDTLTGEIINASRVHFEYTESVTDIKNDTEDSPVYYDLLGREVTHPTHGVFIKRSGTRTDKVII